MSEVSDLIEKLRDAQDDGVYLHADRLAEIGTEEVINAMLKLLYDQDDDIQYLAARTLANIEDNQSALKPLFPLTP